jgi:hypothetical protein
MENIDIIWCELRHALNTPDVWKPAERKSPTFFASPLLKVNATFFIDNESITTLLEKAQEKIIKQGLEVSLSPIHKELKHTVKNTDGSVKEQLAAPAIYSLSMTGSKEQLNKLAGNLNALIDDLYYTSYTLPQQFRS